MKIEDEFEKSTENKQEKNVETNKSGDMWFAVLGGLSLIAAMVCFVLMFIL